MTAPKVNVLLLGSGGRESAIAWKISQSPLIDKFYVAPGNGGTGAYATNLDIKPGDFKAVADAVARLGIDLVVAGNEDPLVGGLREALEADAAARGRSVLIVGPGADGAALEGSKDFAKRFMNRYGIPTARHFTVTAANIDAGRAFLASLNPPYVLKADGLAAGKGVVIVPTLAEVEATLTDMLGGRFGSASAKVVIEEFLSGIECSVFVLTDGTGAYRVLPVAKDYKRVGEGDTGLNTGGMGSVSPVPFADEAFMEKVRSRIIVPTLEGLRAEGIDYRGFIFLGLINVGGEPYVIEYNVRMGDPETEVVMPRIASDLVPALIAAAEGRLGDTVVSEDPRTAVAVMAVSEGYPGSYAKGKAITGLDSAAADIVFHAGTRRDGERVLTDGGRVLAAVAYGNDIEQARAAAYAVLDKIDFDGLYRRGDIGLDLL